MCEDNSQLTRKRETLELPVVKLGLKLLKTPLPYIHSFKTYSKWDPEIAHNHTWKISFHTDGIQSGGHPSQQKKRSVLCSLMTLPIP